MELLDCLTASMLYGVNEWMCHSLIDCLLEIAQTQYKTSHFISLYQIKKHYLKKEITLLTHISKDIFGIDNCVGNNSVLLHYADYGGKLH